MSALRSPAPSDPQAMITPSSTSATGENIRNGTAKIVWRYMPQDHGRVARLRTGLHVGAAWEPDQSGPGCDGMAAVRSHLVFNARAGVQSGKGNLLCQ